MHRIIYFDTNVGYKGVYIKSVQDLMKKQVEIANRGNDIICILDLDGKTVLNRFESFFEHAIRVNGILTLPDNVITA
jgi:hypothetical protein